MDISKRIAERINAETKPVHHLTKGELAQRLGISRPRLARRLSGQTEWHSNELEKLAEIFGITVDELMFGENGKDPA